MSVLYQFLEILKYILPSVVVFLTAYYILRHFSQMQLRRQAMERRAKQQEAVNPIRLQAYERMVLFLERITPQNIVMRVSTQGMRSAQLHQELLSNIRAEFDHNLTQQIYISREAWEAVKRAKEETIKIINIAASKVDDQSSSIELSKFLLEMCMQLDKLPTQLATDLLKEEVRTLF
jgi:uncharacterized membrane protein